MEPLRLYVSIPIASFRVAQAREYWETYPCPPPATVYGMLLSAVGEGNRLVHQGAGVAVALLGQPQRSVILRTLWRVKNTSLAPGIGSNKRPDFQELLTHVRLAVWLRAGNDAAEEKLPHRLIAALENPAGIVRHGGLSLGESTFLVDELRLWRASDPPAGHLLQRTGTGDLSLPVWPDHVGSRGTRWEQYRLTEGPLQAHPPEAAWTEVAPP